MGFKSARKKAKMTALQAARRFGVSQQTVYNWEGGSVLPETWRLPGIAQVYGCTIDELLDGNNPPTG